MRSSRGSCRAVEPIGREHPCHSGSSSSAETTLASEFLRDVDGSNGGETFRSMRRLREMRGRPSLSRVALKTRRREREKAASPRSPATRNRHESWARCSISRTRSTTSRRVWTCSPRARPGSARSTLVPYSAGWCSRLTRCDYTWHEYLALNRREHILEQPDDPHIASDHLHIAPEDLVYRPFDLNLGRDRLHLAPLVRDIGPGESRRRRRRARHRDVMSQRASVRGPHRPRSSARWTGWSRDPRRSTDRRRP
jgi:hypothetical protein